MTTKTRTFRPSADLDAALVETAAREGRSIQEVMRDAVEQYTRGHARRRTDALRRLSTERAELLDRLGNA